MEAQLALDEAQDKGALRARDRAVFLNFDSPPDSDEGLVLRWLNVLRARHGAPRLGARVAAGQRWLGYGLLVAGLISGSASAEVLLAFSEGGSPVNVGGYLAVAVFAQLAAVAVLLLGLLLHALLDTRALTHDLGRLLRLLARKLEPSRERLEGLTGLDPQALALAYRRVRTRVGLYSPLERYTLLGLSQRFFVAFNIGLLLSCLRLVVFSDLAFGWSTSLASLDTDAVERLCRGLSVPFSMLVPEAVPSRVLIEQTQYFRLDGRFSEALPGTKGDALLARQWWPFLVACTVCYGLLPRLGLAAFFAVRLRRAERTVPLDTPDVQAVLWRLRTPEVSTRAAVMDPQSAEPARAVHDAQVVGGRTHLVLYRDLPTSPEQLTGALARLGLQPGEVYRAGGLDAAADRRLCESLGAQAVPVSVVTEAWEAPDAGLRGFLAALRQALGPRVAVRVVLVGEATDSGFAGPDPADVRVYRDRLTLLQDPYLRVEVLTPEASAQTGVTA